MNFDHTGLLDDFQRRISEATMHSHGFVGSSIHLTPIRTIFGEKPFQWGYSLSLKETVSADSSTAAVEKWASLLRFVNGAFEPVSATG